MDIDKTFRKNLMKQLGIAFAVFAILLGGIFFLKSHIKASVAQITNARQELQERTRVLNSLSMLRSQYRNYGEPYFNVLGNIIPQKDELIDISSDFQSIAAQQEIGFGFSFVGESVPDDASDLGYIEFRLNVTAETMEEITEFITNIENFRYLTTVDSINIRRDREAQEINLILQGRVFFQ